MSFSTVFFSLLTIFERIGSKKKKNRLSVSHPIHMDGIRTVFVRRDGAMKPVWS